MNLREHSKVLILFIAVLASACSKFSSFSPPDIKTDDYTTHCENNVCTVYLSEAIAQPIKYRELVKLIESAPKGTVIDMHLSGRGGSTDTVISLYNAIKLSKAEVNTVVDGMTYSSHSYLSMFGKHITIAPGTAFLFHAPAVAGGDTGEYQLMIANCEKSRGSADRGQDGYKKCIDYTESYLKVFDRIVQDKLKPYLTPKEISDMEEGYDVYIDGEDMRQRINRTLK